ncbi:hypothetical protein DE4576_05470 [Mycobacterium marinum]|nr:hypothetical protein DE4576_05470 [Mycobacterium marinum]
MPQETSSDDGADEYDFDIAVSFAGENRGFVEEIVRNVQQSAPDVTVFYDDDYKYESWGKDGLEYFTDVYMNRARFVAMFISTLYAQKEWPRAEKRAALARALTERSEYVLPIRLDDTELPGMPPTVLYIEAVREGIEGITKGILHKLGEKRVKPTKPYHGKVAKTKEELRELIAQRTPVWEFVLYGSVLYQEREELRPLILDHSIGYAPRNGRRVTELGEAIQLQLDTLSDFLGFSEDFNKLLSPEVHAAAFGAPGEPGDPERIVHLGERFMSVYKQLLDIAANLRGMQPHPSLAQYLQLIAKITDQPLADLDEFIDKYVDLVNDLHDKVINGDQPEYSHQIVVALTLDDDVLDAVTAERERLQAESDDD